jgi:hypothetical protein
METTKKQNKTKPKQKPKQFATTFPSLISLPQILHPFPQNYWEKNFNLCLGIVKLA